MIVKHKFVGIGTKKNEIFGDFRSGGISSNLDFWQHFYEKNQIRIDNNQNKVFLFILIFVKLFYNFKKIKYFKISEFIDFLKKSFL